MMRITRVDGRAGLFVVLLIAASAAGVIAGQAASTDPAPGEDVFAPGASPLALKGYPACMPGPDADCGGFSVTMAFYRSVTGDTSIRLPADSGLPICPPPTPDKGFGDDTSAAADGAADAPSCAVSSDLIVTHIWMSSADAKALTAAVGCGDRSTPCAQADADRYLAYASTYQASDGGAS